MHIFFWMCAICLAQQHIPLAISPLSLIIFLFCSDGWMNYIPIIIYSWLSFGQKKVNNKSCIANMTNEPSHICKYCYNRKEHVWSATEMHNANNLNAQKRNCACVAQKTKRCRTLVNEFVRVLSKGVVDVLPSRYPGCAQIILMNLHYRRK